MSNESPASTRKLFERPKAIAGMVGGLVVFLGGVFTLVEKLSPGGPPPGPVAVISEPGATPGVTLRSYLNSQPGRLNAFVAKANAQGITLAELRPVLDADGVEASFTLELSGQVGTSFEVMRDMFSVAGNVRVPAASTTVVPPPHYTLRGPREHFVGSTWIEDPPHSGSYHVELVVLDAGGEELAHKTSGAFPIG